MKQPLSLRGSEERTKEDVEMGPFHEKIAHVFHNEDRLTEIICRVERTGISRQEPRNPEYGTTGDDERRWTYTTRPHALRHVHQEKKAKKHNTYLNLFIFSRQPAAAVQRAARRRVLARGGGPPWASSAASAVRAPPRARAGGRPAATAACAGSSPAALHYKRDKLDTSA